jgi:hypothetical protein
MTDMSIRELEFVIKRIDTEMDSIESYYKNHKNKNFIPHPVLKPNTKGMSVQSRMNYLIGLRETATDILNLKMFMSDPRL